MKVKTIDLKDIALDWAVAKCEFPYANTKDIEVWVQPLPCDDSEDFKFQPSTDWAQGGLIIEREKIAIDWDHDCWNASTDSHPAYYSAETPLVAAMRCYVASQLGDEVEIPKELIK